MLPKIEPTKNSVFRKENFISSIQNDEYIRNLLAKSQNKNYKPWDNKYILQKHNSPFGEFPSVDLKKNQKNTRASREYTPEIVIEKKNVSQSLSARKLTPIRNKSLNLTGKKKKGDKKPIAGAYQKRLIPITEFRRFALIKEKNKFNILL